MSDHDDEAARLRADLDGVQPGDERDVEVRLQLADVLLADFESRADAALLAGAPVDLSDLDEVRYHAEWVTTWVDHGSEPWMWAQQQLVDLLLQRYNAAPADDCTHLMEAIGVLRALSATELSGTQRGAVDSVLGLALVERFRWDRNHAATTASQLSEAHSVLEGSLRFLDLDDPQRAEVVLELARLYSFRATVDDAEFSADAEGDLDEAIHLFRSLAGTAPTAALGLAEALASRHAARSDPARSDPADRDEAIALLKRLEGEPDLAWSPTERAAVLGELLLDRAKEHPGEIDDLVSYLETALEVAQRVDGSLSTLLIEAYCLREHPRPTDLDRMIHLVDAMMAADPAEMPDKPTLLALRSTATAALALRTYAPEELDRAARRLREASRHVLPFDWTHLALLGLLGVVVVVQHDREVAVDGLNPMCLFREFPPERRADLLRWLEEHRDVVSEANTDLVTAIALLRSDRAGNASGAPVAEQERVRREAVAALEAARASLPADDALDLVLQQQVGYQYTELGQLLERAEEIDHAVALLDDVIGRMGADHPLHTITLALYAGAVMTARLHSELGPAYRHARTSLTRAVEDPDLEPAARSVFLHVLAQVEAMAWLDDRQTGSITTAVDYCQQALNLLSEDDPQHDEVRHSLVILLMDRFKMVGELHDLDAAVNHLHALRDIVGERGDDAVLTEAIVAETIEQVELVRATARLTSPTSEDVDRALAHLTTRLSALEERAAAGERVDGNVLAGLRSDVAVALMQKALITSDLEPLGAAARQLTTAAASVTRGTARWVWFQTAAGAALALSGASRADRVVFDAGIGKLATVWEDDELADDHRGQAALALVSLWLTWHLKTRDDAALDVALDHFDRVGALGGQFYERADTALLLDRLAEALWKRGRPGDVDRALDIGFQSLRKRAGDVLLQTTGDHGLQRAADAAGRALVIAVRCLTFGQRERAVEAVESGRGLVLHTMTVTTDVATLLRECGRDALADEWQRAAATEPAQQDVFPPPGSSPSAGTALDFVVDFAPSDLRHRVLTALSDESSSHRLLSPPSVANIAVALRELEADVLVYLIPAQSDHSGRALLVTAGEQTHEVVLPLLNDDVHGQVGQYLDARRAAEDPDLPEELIDSASTIWRRELEALCGWAWRAVVGPLLKRLSSLGLGGLGLGARPPRLVLVPSGALGVVPWHAARGDGRIAVQDAVFSYAASARQLCDLAARPRRPLAEAPVVVTDPMGTLPGALPEAEFLHRCYPNGRFYGIEVDGVPHNGDGTPEEVLSAVPGAGQPGASVLHLGCHARSGATLSHSYLEELLDGSVLTVDRILNRARSRPRGVVGGLVVLAACQSDLTEAAHDEALTLASAFVAAGATGVVGTKWAIHDIGSSVLMCIFHAELTRHHQRPRDALRAVQLWALDPQRPDPGGLPSYLAHKLRSLDLSHPAIWAGFTHQGW